MRSFVILCVAASIVVAGFIAYASLWAAEPEAKPADPWVGNYLKFGQWEPRTGQFGESPQIAITKEGDTYRLSKPYDSFVFNVTEKGVISDGKGGIGSIYLGTAQFVDGHRVRVLRAEFCYERFILYDLEEKAQKK